MAKAHFPIGLFRHFFLLSACVLTAGAISACAVFSPSTEPDREPVRQTPRERPAPDPAGLPGKRSSEAEMAFDQARVLWKGGGASASLGEVCADPVKAVRLLDKAIALDPKYGEAYVRRGMAKSDLGDAEAAFEDISRGIRISPGAEAYAHRGMVLLRDGQLGAAKRDFAYSLQLRPDQHLAHNYLGVAALSGDKKTEACKSFGQGCSNGDCSFLEYARKEKLCP